MTDITVEGGNGNTLAWRLGRLEAEVEGKADTADMERMEKAVNSLTASVNRLILLAFAATLSGATAAILVAVQISSQ